MCFRVCVPIFGLNLGLRTYVCLFIGVAILATLDLLYKGIWATFYMPEDTEKSFYAMIQQLQHNVSIFVHVRARFSVGVREEAGVLSCAYSGVHEKLSVEFLYTGIYEVLRSIYVAFDGWCFFLLA